MSELPRADARQNDTNRKKIKAVVSKQNLASAANNTKWNELIDYFRQRSGWHPSYRSKSITGHISDWDVEWFYHLPFPFAYVEWFDIGLWQAAPSKGALLPQTFIDHTEEISGVVAQIGFEFEVRADVLRIWGYLPKSYEDFPPA
ncbi:hypothetical protein BFW87_01180 [Pseudomonas fluorescens]|uniref:Uncharacterized protein n=1 Tax=Pseudomonas fluorescens TaxID=294 RepID=A0A1T2Z9R9_PSEFL|nr:DUF6678 family protein [Pseudomonas fluorescens]OPB01039.1 hypothetical protein BFW87_01180 [Pseudomonas fluorescens]